MYKRGCNTLSIVSVCSKKTMLKPPEMYPKVAWSAKRKKRVRNKSLKSQFKEFADATSMHGLRYVADEEATLPERLLWIGIFIACFSMAVYFVRGMWVKWNDFPLLISIESTEHPNDDVLFPSVSICSVNKVSNASLQRRIQNISASDILTLLSGMMRSENINVDVKRLEELEDVVDLQNLTSEMLINFLKSTAVPCQSMILSCKWQNEEMNCSELFQLMPSSQGFCCVFNGNTMEAIADPGGKLKNFGAPVNEPWKALGDGVHMGLTVLLDAQISDYALATSSFYGFKVLIQHPEDQPDPTSKGLAIGPGTEVFAAISTSTVSSSDEVRKMDMISRKCRFSDENNLRYFKKYSKNNCLTENLAKLIQMECQCLPFYFLVGDKKAPTCSFSKNPCVQDAIKNFHLSDLKRNCPATCNSISYSSEISYGPFPNDFFINSPLSAELPNNVKNDPQYLRSNIALVHVFLRDSSGIQYRRDTRYGWQDFVSSVGGLLGLAMGFSLMSLVEILYFCGLRWSLRSCKRKRVVVQHDASQIVMPYFVHLK